MVYTLHLSGIPSDAIHKCMTYVGDRAIGVSKEVTEFMVRKLKVPEYKCVTTVSYTHLTLPTTERV